MIGRQSHQLIAWIGLSLFLAGLGCSIYRTTLQPELAPKATTIEDVTTVEETATGDEIEYHQAKQGTLTGGGQHEWVFNGKRGDVITISVNGREVGMIHCLELFAPNGVQIMADEFELPSHNQYYRTGIAAGVYGYDPKISEIELPSNGIYRVIVRNWRKEPSKYRLTLTRP